MSDLKASGAISAIASLALSVPSLMLTGLVLSDLWRWFVVPLGAMQIGKAHAIGLCMLLGLAKYRVATSDLRAESKPFDSLIKAIGGVLASLAFWAYGAIMVTLIN